MIGLGLLDIAATTFDLPKIEERWPEERGYGKIIYAQEWHNLMGALSYLEKAHREGEMTSEQEYRYRELKLLLKGSVPVLKKLDFTLLPVPLDV